MAAAQHKLSRRALLAGACVAPVLPLTRHSGLEPEPRNAGGAPVDTAVFMGPGFRRDDALGAKAWAKALARLKHAEAQIAALAHSEDEDAYDHAVDRQIAALSRVLTARAPDLSAVAWKIGLIARHAAWELDCGAAALAVLQDDVLRIAA